MYHAVQCLIYFYFIGAAFPATLLRQPFARFVDLQLKNGQSFGYFLTLFKKKTNLQVQLQKLHVVVRFFQI